MTPFEKRLEEHTFLLLTAKVLVPGETNSLDLRAARIIYSHGSAGGVASAQIAAMLLTGNESNRILHAVHELLADLVEASPEEIPARLRELIESYDTITAHLDQALTAISSAQQEMKDARHVHAVLTAPEGKH